MTEKELRKLKRQDYLQLLLSQGQEMVELRQQLEETTSEKEQTQNTNDRLKAKLDEKDALIEKLKGRLDAKDATIRDLNKMIKSERESRRIELEEAGSIAMASLHLNGVFEAAQKAVDQYLYNIKLRCEELDISTEEFPTVQEVLGVDESEGGEGSDEDPSVPKPVYLPAQQQEEEPAADTPVAAAFNKLKSASSASFSKLFNLGKKNS